MKLSRIKNIAREFQYNSFQNYNIILVIKILIKPGQL